MDFLFLLYEASVEDVDTIQEFTDILVLNEAGLMDLSARKRDGIKIISFKDDLILNFFLSRDLDTFGDGDLSDDLFTQEVSDFEGSGTVRDKRVDGEMGIGESHLILVTFSNTIDHILDVGSNGADAGLLLSLGHPDLELELASLFTSSSDDGEGNVLESLGEDTSLTLNSNFTSLEVYFDSCRNVDKFFSENVFHCLASLII